MSVPPFQAFILGIVQGLTEFLPISSSAHLILVPRLAGWADAGLAFDVALHLGTLTGVLAYFWRDLLGLAQACVSYKEAELAPKRRLVGLLALATVPAVIAGFLLEDYVETVFRSPAVVGWTLIGGGLALAAADYLSKGVKQLGQLTSRAALAIGLAQSLALVPGVSRSGATITMGVALGYQRKEAARFSFLMSIPVIAGAGLLKMKDIYASSDHAAMAAGFLGAAISGFLAIWGLLRFVQTHRFTPFVIYRILLGILILSNLQWFA